MTHQAPPALAPTITFAGDAANGEIKLKPTDTALPFILKEVSIVGPLTTRGSGVPAGPNANQTDTRLFRTAADGVLTLKEDSGIILTVAQVTL